MDCLCQECFYECCDIDDDIIRNKDTPIAKKIVSIILIIGIGVCLILGCFFDFKYYQQTTPYFIKSGGYPSTICLIVIITALASALALFFLILYFICGFCCKSCPCMWGAFNFMILACIVLQFVIYVLGTSKNGSDGMKCSKPLAECYYGMYNQTLSKITDESNYYKYYERWQEFYNWYLGKLGNLHSICGKYLGPALAIAIVQFVIYVTLIMIYGGWECISEKCCCCCCKDVDCDKCWNCGKSKEQVSNEEDKSADDLKNENNNMVPNQNNQNIYSMIPNQNNQNNNIIPDQNNQNNNIVSEQNNQNNNDLIPNQNYITSLKI
ncbi:hypothetical protein M9Y10_037640 [Tritrichomonas musculus]|uniref:Tetraspanin family protein n=1 Tax=Tritrichomonas musculus TaxID=1915356 RepID=A0ABR2GSV8_9EUKA